jgi:hypothetical protein
MIDNREMMRFEKYMREEHPIIVFEWENLYSEFTDLDEFLKNNYSDVWRNWLNHKNVKDE